MGIAVIK